MRQFTDQQVIAAVEEMGSQAAAALHLGINKRTLERRLAKIRDGEDATEERQSGGFEIPEGHIVKGTSTLYDATTGEPKLEWVKTDLDKPSSTQSDQQ